MDRARIAAESLTPGVKVSDVARRHGVTRWQVYDWRKRLALGRLAMPADALAEPAFAALVVETPPQTTPPRKSRREKGLCRIDLVVAGITVRVGADVDEAQRRLEGIIGELRREKFGRVSEELDPEPFNLPFKDVEIAQGILEAA